MTAEEAKPERLHPLSLLSGLGQAARNLVGGIAAGGFLAFQGRLEVAVLVLGGIALATVAGLLLHWLRFSFRVGEDSIRIDSGVLSRTHRSIPFDRVTDVSIAQGPLQRLFGLAKVTLETGGSGGAEEGVLDGVALDRAEALREHVRARRGTAGGPELPEAHEAEPAPLFAMDLRRVLACGLFNFSLAMFAGLFGASQTLGNVFDVDPFERAFWQPILNQRGWSRWLLDHQVALALGGLAVLVLAGVATGLIRTLLREYGFRLDRTGTGLRRRRGLLTRTDVSLPLRRMQAGLIVTGPIRERFGWRAFKVLSLAGENVEGNKGESRDHVLAPLAREEEIARIARELGLAMPEAGTGWHPVSKAHLWSFATVLVPAAVLLTGFALAVLYLGGDGAPRTVASSLAGDGSPWLAGLPTVAFGAGLASFLFALRWLEWRYTAWAVEGGQLFLRKGWWRRRTLLLPLRNVQSVALTENALSRAFAIATLNVDVAGGALSGQRIPSLPRNEASLLRRELLRFQP